MVSTQAGRVLTKGMIVDAAAMCKPCRRGFSRVVGATEHESLPAYTVPCKLLGSERERKAEKAAGGQGQASGAHLGRRPGAGPAPPPEAEPGGAGRGDGHPPPPGGRAGDP